MQRAVHLQGQLGTFGDRLRTDRIRRPWRATTPRAKAFLDIIVTLKRRIQPMLALPLARLGRLAIPREVKHIGSRCTP